MKLSATERTGDGSRRDFTFSFVGEDTGYLRESDLTVQVTDPDDEEGNPAPRRTVPFELTSTNTLQLEEAPVEGAAVLIRRVMPKDKNYADFKRGNNFREQVINNSFLQLLYTIHELLDGYFSGNVEFQDDVSFLNDVLIKGALEVGGDTTLQGLLVNLGATIEEDLAVEGGLTVGGSASIPDFSGNVEFQDNVLIHGTLGVTGDTTLQGLLVKLGAVIDRGLTVSDFLRVIRNTPNDQQTVMNIAGNDNRYLRKEGGTAGTLNATRMTVQEVGTTGTSVINRAFADNRYYKNTGGRVSGVVDATHSGVLTKDPSEPASAVNKRTLDAVVSDLDNKILGMKSNAEELLAAIADAILEGSLKTSCNAPVLYHKRFLDAPIVVPEDCEARTFGSELKILEGGSLYLGAGTEWRFFNDDGKTP